MSPDNKEKKTILLIDDDTSLLVTLSDFLKFEGYEVVTAESGERGLEQLKAITPDLIVLDMSMPGMGGTGFLKEITKRGRPGHPVLVLTARATMAEFFSHTQVDGFVAKPCDPADLLMEIGRIIFLRSGEEPEEEIEEHGHLRRVLLGENRKDVSDKLSASLEVVGYSVERVFSGPDVLESAIVGKPDVVAMRLPLCDMNALAVADVLSQMPNTKSIPVVVYGMDEGGIDLELQTAVDEHRIAKAVSSAESADILRAISQVISTIEE